MNTSVNDILDSTLDDLADLPETKPFPAGVHKATMFLSAPAPKPGKNPQVIAKFKHRETVELVDASAVSPNPEDESTIFISLKKKDGTPNEFGQGQVKQLLAPLAAAGLTGTSRELIEATKAGIDVVIVVATRDYNGTDQQTLKSIELDQ